LLVLSIIMRLASFTVDVDRDVNMACTGQSCALSKEGEGLGQPRFNSSSRGLKTIVNILKKHDVRGTFFFEARTAIEISKELDLAALMQGHEIACHGFDHEDLTGAKTGVRLTDKEVDVVLEKSSAKLLEIFGAERSGFRAPYQATDIRLQQMLKAKGFRYESSLTMPLIDGRLRPYTLEDGLLQVPIASGLDQQGKKIVAYLWPMHEGKRVVQDYLHLLGQFQDGLFVMATHSWHMCENFSWGRLGEIEEGLQENNLSELIKGAQDQGIEFTRIDDYLDEHHGGSC
jgi:peptidoglycan-N-acetylglucosamine deacetylase